MKLRVLALGFLCLLGPAPFAAESPVLTIQRNVTISTESSPGLLYDFQAASTLENWTSVRKVIGSGRPVSASFEASGHGFYRVQAQAFPKLQNFQIVAGGRNPNPAVFNPDIYHFAFRQNAPTTRVKPTFGEDVASCTINGAPVANGGTYEFTSTEFNVTNLFHLDIDLVGTNNLKTRYVCRVLPANFLNLTATNNLPSDPDSAILATIQGPARTYAVFLDTNGVPYWWKPLNTSFNFKLHDNGLLSHIQNFGTNEAGYSEVRNVVMDQYFNPLMSVGAIGKVSKNHQFILTTRGTAYVLGQTNLVRDLTELNGQQDVPTQDNVIQEISLLDNKVIWEFNTWGNVSYVHSYYPGQSNYSHLNWVWESRDGNLLTSSRGMSQILKIDKATTNVLWRLGRMGDFAFVDDPRGGFAGQHCVTEMPNGNILLFDNRNLVSSSTTLPEDGPSRIVEYQLDHSAKTARLVFSYQRDGFHSINQGGAMRLPDGNTLIAWGNGTPLIITEVNSDGQVVFDIAAQDDQGRLAGAYVAYKIKKDALPGLAARTKFGPIYP